ncbi:MAG: L,D-transpeptidase family protein [Candidatus Kaelpia aquatica]|nr:L,D-transpeptidase family protein [Candidatus Kaelpia aquatica]
MDRRVLIIILLVVVGGGFLIWGINSSKEDLEQVYQDQSTTELSQDDVDVSVSSEIEDISQFDTLIEEGAEGTFEEGLLFAEQLTKNNKLIEAKEVYKRLVRNFSSHPDLGDLEQKLWDINMKVMFSPIQTDDSVIYEVKEGDSLYLIAKNFNTTVGFLKRSNGLSSDLIRIGQRLKIVTSISAIIVDKSLNILTLKMNDEIVKVYPCSTGEFNSTPTGDFKIINKLPNPTWYKAGAIVPPDSDENILGSRWMGFELSGYGIHGTTKPGSIGQQVTAGCIRLYNEDVEELYDVTPTGTKVTIIE